MLGQLFALLTAVCWAQNSVSYSIAGKRVTSRTVTHIRLWIALPAVFAVHYFFLGTILPPVTFNYQFLMLAASGFIGFFIADVFIFHGFVLIGPGRTLLVLTLSPIISAIISFLTLGESLGFIQTIGMLVTIFGILLVVYFENISSGIARHELKGFIYAAAGALAQAAAMVMSKIGLGNDVHPVSANVIRISAGLAGLVIFAALKGEFFNDFKKMKDRKALLLIFFAALIGPVLGIIMTLYALQLAPVGIVTTLTQISPILLLPVEAVFFKRRISFPILSGTFIAVSGAVILFLL